jgi:hypothetical protein
MGGPQCRVSEIGGRREVWWRWTYLPSLIAWRICKILGHHQQLLMGRSGLCEVTEQ